MIRSLPGPGFFRPTGVIHLLFSPLSIRATTPGGRRVGNAISKVHNTRVSPLAMSAMPPNDGASVLKPALRTTTDGEANEPSSLKGQYLRDFSLAFSPGRLHHFLLSVTLSRHVARGPREPRRNQFRCFGRGNLTCMTGVTMAHSLHASVPCQRVRVRSSDRI